jgi:hypothetical protein
MLTLRIVQWAAEECDRQHSGELSVHRMVQAWDWSYRHLDVRIDLDDILILGKIIEPAKNANGFRNTPVTAGGRTMLTPRLIEPALTRIVRHQPDVGQREYFPGGSVSLADQWYKDFEEIHPFLDGNGRAGSILWNFLSGTLAEPSAPPDLWRGH